ncbi:hypothetical protein OIU84_012290 [Salix udensis]|uniref:Agenet domain-containing protein n=1 Tax=Salix udensis TaxID=889485 RepID=A0AAD6JFE0_9ROSI|nr:hypothetical protein OIU84_012290 [Salix udensis]
MVGLDSSPQPQQNPQQQDQTIFFNKGEEVEVSSEEEGFRGAWYVATILEFPKPQPQATVKSASKKKRKAIVQYKTLVTEDGSIPLVEQVDPHLIRPLPPQDLLENDGFFQENEAIDATLRLHLDWVDGNWVRPKRQRQATVVIKENEDKTFLVKCLSSRNSDEAGTMKTIVDFLRIRPCPPCYEDRNYELLERGNEDKELSHSRIRPHLDWVDGKWISKSKEVRVVSDSQGQFVGTNSSDNPDVAVQLKSSSAAEDKTIEKTVSSSISNPTETNSGEKSVKKLKLTLYNGGGIRSSASTTLTEVDTTEASVSVTALQSRKIPIEMSSNEKCCGFTTSKTGGKRARCIEKHMADAHPSNKTEKFSAGKTTKAKPHRVPELDCPKVDIVTRKGRVTKSPFKSPNVSAAVDGDAVEVTVQGISENDVKTKDIEVPIIIGQEHGMCGKQPKKKEGKTMQINRKIKALVASKDFVSVDIANEVVQVVVKDLTTNEVEWPTQARVEPKVSQNSSREKSSEAPKTDFMSREAAAAASQNVAEDDQPLSTWFGNMQAPTSLEESRLSTGRMASGVSAAREKHVVEVETSTVDPKSNDTLVGNQSVPFVKKSLVWNTIESMGVFQIIPQKPHFHPLTECKEEYREGSAIGIMVTFASLFEKISSLKFDDCRSILESTLESLVDLEKHGFDITVPRCRLNELLSIKDGQGEVLNESKDADSKIQVHTDEKRKLEEKINDIEKKITELQEELALTKEKMEAKGLDISKMQSHAAAINERIKNSRDHFVKVASAPWKSP